MSTPTEHEGACARHVAGVVTCLTLLAAGCMGAPAADPERSAVPAIPRATPSAPTGSVPVPAAMPGVTPDPAGQVPFSPDDLAIAPDGTLYATDCGGGRVYRVAAGTAPVSVVGLGSGFQPFDGEGGPGWAAHLECPWGIAFDAHGRLLVVDHGHGRVRRVEDDGIITTVVGGGGVDVTGDTPAVNATLSEPQSVVVDAAGNLLISDRTNRIFRVGEDGTIAVIAGSGQAGFSGDGGPATEAQLSTPAGLALDAAGDLLVADTYNNRIRRINTVGIITTAAGTGEPTSTGDGGQATNATLAEPYSVLLDRAGNLLIGETGEDRSYTFAGAGNRYRRVTPDGRIEAFAGTGRQGYAGDGGQAVDALLAAYDGGMGMAIDADGRIYLADSGNHAVRVVDTDGIITTFAVVVPAGG